MKYVLEKIELTERQPHDNMAGYFLARLTRRLQDARAVRPCKKGQAQATTFADPYRTGASQLQIPRTGT